MNLAKMWSQVVLNPGSSQSTVFNILVILIVIPYEAHCYAEKWTIGVPGGSDKANQVAVEHGYVNLGLVRGFDDVYLFEKQVDGPDTTSFDDADPTSDARLHRTKRALEAHPCVSWVDPQLPQTRVKRDAFNKQVSSRSVHRPLLSLNSAIISGSTGRNLKGNLDRGSYSNFGQSKEELNKFNDELWSHQWYLQDNSNVAQVANNIELRVEEVWKMGYTGEGIVVTILDDGLEWNHTDILPNYDARASFDMNHNRSDPFPSYDIYNSNSHGTRCAGEVAMVANNRKCGVGVAPRAKIGGIKCLDGIVEDSIEAMSLLHNIDYIDIYSGSWGPQDDGKTVDGPKRTAKMALERGAKYGRQGKGALYIWASGNGGTHGDNCNCDGYISSIYTISIGGVTQQGQLPFYGERCASTMAVACSSGAHTDRKIVTTDLHNKCTVDYSGTSAAAPLAAGVYALLLEANNNLTWRDVQHLTAWTSDPVPIKDNPGWKRNGAGLVFNSRFGFGLLNAKALVDAAIKWQNVPRKSICIVSHATRLPVFLQSRNMAQVIFTSDGCQREYENQQKHAQFQPVSSARSGGVHGGHRPTPVMHLEHVEVIVDIEYTSRGSLDIFLISPSGTISTLLTRRPLDVSRDGFNKWPLMSLHFWGETSAGKWTLIVRDKDSRNNRGLLRNATLILHGTTQRPAHALKPRTYDDETHIKSFLDPVLELDEDDIYDLNTFPNEMSLVRDDSYQPTFIKSLIATQQAKNLRS